MGESTVTTTIRVPKTLIEQMKSDGFTENFGYYLEDIYNRNSWLYRDGEILCGADANWREIQEQKSLSQNQ